LSVCSFARWDERRGEVLLGRIGDGGGGVENFDNWEVGLHSAGCRNCQLAVATASWKLEHLGAPCQASKPMSNEVLLHLTRQVFPMLCCSPSQRCATLDLLLSSLPVGTNQSTNAKCTANRAGAVGTLRHQAPSLWTLPRTHKLVGLVLPAAIGSVQLIE
jgi:hypothetical protein